MHDLFPFFGLIFVTLLAVAIGLIVGAVCVVWTITRLFK